MLQPALLGKPVKGARVVLNYPGLYLDIILNDSLDIEILNRCVAAAQSRQLKATFKRI